MNGPAHQLAGAVAAIAISAKDHEHNTSPLHHPVVAGTVGALLGRLPDALEPALRNPHHRQFFHSVTMLGLIGWGVYKVHQWEPEDDFERLLRCLLLLGGAACLSHLALDAVTSRSLPLVGRL
jgi:inner membrane protein